MSTDERRRLTDPGQWRSQDDDDDFEERLGAYRRDAAPGAAVGGEQDMSGEPGTSAITPDLERLQFGTIVTTLAEHSGLTAYALGMYIPVPQPGPDEQRRTGLLGKLERASKVRQVPGPNRIRWYLADTRDAAPEAARGVSDA